MNKIHFKFKTIAIVLSLCLVSAIGIFLVMFLTSIYGASLTPDSAAYLAGAKNIAHGNGITILYNDTQGLIPLKLWASSISIDQPLIFHWPPFYSIVLSLFVLIKINLFNGARILNAVFFGINIFLICHIIWKSTKSLILSLLSGIIFLSSIVMLGLHAFIMSEPLFILSGFSAIFILLSYFENKKIYYFIITSILLGISFLTRYIGIAFTLTSAIAIFLFDKTAFKNKFIRFFSLMLISFTPIIIWLYRTSVAGNNLTDREISFHPPSVEELSQIPGIILKWFLIKDLGRIGNLTILIMLIAIIIILTVFVAKKEQKNSNGLFTYKFICILLIFIPIYIFILVLSRTFFDAKIPIAQDRLLSPLFIAFLIIFILLVSYFYVFFVKKKYMKAVILLGIFIFAGFNIFSCTTWYRDIYSNGQGYSQKYFFNSQLIGEIKKMPEDTVIYSDAADMIYLFTGKTSYFIPVEYDPYTTTQNKNYDSQVDEMFQRIEDGKGVLINFSGLERPFISTVEDLKKKTNVCLYFKGNDGEIYKIYSQNLEEVFKSDYTNFSDYWRPMNQCVFEKENEKVNVLVSGDDPWFESKFPLDFASKRPLMLVLFLDSRTNGEIRIFYGRGEKEYIYEDSYGESLDSGFNRICFLISGNDGEELIKKIRIDPIDKKMNLEIEKIELYYVNE